MDDKKELTVKMQSFFDRGDISPLTKFFILIRWQTAMLSRNENAKNEVWKVVKNKLFKAIK